jgi:hypothetical protein
MLYELELLYSFTANVPTQILPSDKGIYVLITMFIFN